MNTALAIEKTVGSDAVATKAVRRKGFYESLVMRGLQRFEHGGLRLLMPDGEVVHLGNKDATATAEIRIKNANFFKRCAWYGNVGFGEAYVDGDWETDDIAAVVAWFIDNLAKTPGLNGSSGRLRWANFLNVANRWKHWLRANTIGMSQKNIAEHYDLGNDFYSLWLDGSMTYSSARFLNEEQSLEDAQKAKYEALCRKLELKPGDKVLEIGCGWGGFCSYAASRYGCSVTAVTISEEQRKYATERMEREGLSDRVEIRLQDYRHLEGRFDKICSIEMLEAVGDEFVDGYFKKCAELLKPEGLFAFQVITTPDYSYEDLRKGVDWIQKHIFPGSLLMSVGRINQAVNRTSRLFMHGLEDLGPSYAKTLRIWHERFNARLAEVKAQGFDDCFVRKWNYYLKYCEAAFETGNISVVQAVYKHPNNAALSRHAIG